MKMHSYTRIYAFWPDDPYLFCVFPNHSICISISFEYSDNIPHSISANWAYLMLSFLFESFSTWLAQALVTTWVEYAVFLVGQTDHTYICVKASFVNGEHFYNKLFISQISFNCLSDGPVICIYQRTCLPISVIAAFTFISNQIVSSRPLLSILPMQHLVAVL